MPDIIESAARLGAKANRPGLAKALAFGRRGDTLVTWKLDRLGRSMAHLIEMLRKLGPGLSTRRR